MECDVTKLSAKYESNGDPAAIGWDVVGGWSYGKAQIATKPGTMNSFLTYLKTIDYFFYNALINAGGNVGATNGTTAFKNMWKNLAKVYAKEFTYAQDMFILNGTYNLSVRTLTASKVDLVTNRSCTLQNVIYSFSVMAGVGKFVANGRGFCGLFFDTLSPLGGPNALSTINDSTLIDQIYAMKLHRIDTLNEYSGQTASIRASVRRRIVNEHNDAVVMLAAESATTIHN